jgi:predicted protein tyrosine phosphatase
MYDCVLQPDYPKEVSEMENTILVVPRRALHEIHSGNAFKADRVATIHIYSFDSKPIDHLKGKFLALQFDDIEKPMSYKGRDLILFTEAQAKQIVAFLDEIKDTHPLLLCSCDAGISRSGAVGEFACDYLGLDKNKFYAHNPFIHPNIHVKTMLWRVVRQNNSMKEGVAG